MNGLLQLVWALLVIQQLERRRQSISEDVLMTARRQQYTEAGEFLRHYSGLRFVVFPVYLGAEGALFALAREFTAANANWAVRVGFVSAAFLLTLVFLRFEGMLAENIDFFELKLGALDETLGYDLMTGRGRRGPRFLTARRLMWALFVAVSFAWAAWLLWPVALQPSTAGT